MAAASSFVVLATGILVLLGWGFDVALLKSVFPGLVTMKANTALLLFLGGLSLWLQRREGSPLRVVLTARTCACFVTIIGAATLLEYLTARNFGIDEILFLDRSAPSNSYPGRMSPATALAFVLTGSALFLLDVRAPRACLDGIGLLTFLIALLALIGYLYSVRDLYTIAHFTAMALHTSCAFLILSLGILFARSDRGLASLFASETPGGVVTRRLLPSVIVIPLILGWIRLEGERAGLYGTALGLALFAVSNIVLLGALALWAGFALKEAAVRQRIEEQGRLRLATAVVSSNDAIITKDLQGIITSWNQGAERIFGYQEKDVLGKPGTLIIPPEGLDEEKRILGRILLKQRIEHYTTKRVRRDGTLVDVSLTVSPILNPEGDVVGAAEIARDITKELLAERELRASEARFRATFDQAAVGIAHVSPEGRWLRVNQKLCEIVGYSAEELLAKTFQDITHPDDLEKDLALVRQVLEGTLKTYTLEKRYFHKSGSLTSINLTVSLVRTSHEKPDYFIAVVEDISARKAAEVALQNAESRLRSLSEANLIGIIVADLRGTILDANPAFLNMVGYTHEDVVSGKVRWADMTPPEFKALDERAVAQLQTTGIATPWEKEYIRKDGRRLPILLGVSMVKGTQDQCVAFVLDLSDRRRLEDQLRQAQRMEVIGRLAGGIAHDFNNLLTPIIGYSELILGGTPQEDPRRPELEEIRRAGARASELTRQLLAFSRKQVLQPKILDLNTQIEESAKLIRRVIGEDVTLNLALAPKLGLVKCDPTQFEQVLMNLAVNARDAMPRGGKLTIETMNVDLDPSSAAKHAEATPGPYVLVAVSDTGIGMDQATKDHLFEPFFTTKATGMGTGLGLATVHGIVRQSQGHIWVYSEVGRGTTFKIYWPITKESVPDHPKFKQDPGVLGGSETILLVEDDSVLRTFAIKVLRAKGYTVLEAGHGEAALVLSKTLTGSIDLLVTDVVMPGISGREVAQQIRAARPHVKVLYISGYTENAIVHHGVLDQGTDLLEKPFTPNALARAVRMTLDRRQST